MNKSSSPFDKMILPEELLEVLRATDTVFATDRDHLVSLAFEGKDTDLHEVSYEIEGKGEVVEATVVRCKNGVSVNYKEPYMRRRDPEAMFIADDQKTDKRRFGEHHDIPFNTLRQDTFEWLKKQPSLIILPFYSGDEKNGYPTILVCPKNAGFFAAALGDLQGVIYAKDIPKNFKPVAAIYVAPPFRHTHFKGKQVVVHNRLSHMHELFAYNLYPGPSAKKGVYGILLTKGEKDNWLTLHCSTVRVITPYDNEFIILHEGASGSGKSEMVQEIHREPDGRILLGENIITHEKLYIDLIDACDLQPVTDDMAMAHPDIQKHRRRLTVKDAEDGWFMRVDTLKEYGTEPTLEKICISPPEPLIFLNIDVQPRATCLPWEHILDAPGKPCPNPRVIMPRRVYPNVFDGAVSVDVRSFGVRTPPCTQQTPNYGIISMLHILPAAIAWLWRLAAPRGHSNPSIVGPKGLMSEGVGSYWPFATGSMVRHANLLLEMMYRTTYTRFVLIPNQYIGAYHVGFKAQWLVREYMARRGSVNFRPDQLEPSRCPLLGFTIPSLRINGQNMPNGFLRVHEQLEVGIKGYDQGASILTEFFEQELKKFYSKELHPKGRAIIDICLSGGDVEQYCRLFP